MEAGRLIHVLSRVSFKLSTTLLVFSAVVLLWLRPVGSSLGILLIVMAINGTTLLLSLLVLFLSTRKPTKKQAIIDTLERHKQEETDE